uniref:ZP domain-containing protein n=1 Tax=Caenorhabditis japonica TaxID=281687 RepID=A0A8R1DFM8_CAEJA
MPCWDARTKAPAAHRLRKVYLLISQPYISCQKDRIVIEVITERLFTGKVFVKGDYANPQCTRTFRNGAVVNEKMTGEEIFEGTVTKSREPYVEEREQETSSGSKSSIRENSSGSPVSEEQFAKSGTTRPKSRNGNSSGRSSERLEEASRANFNFPSSQTSTVPHEPEIQKGTIFPPDIAETFLLPKRNESDEEGEWKGVGGASAGPNAIFGGTRGEELRIFGKSGASNAAKRRGSASTLSPPHAQCAPTTCEPCVCEERRTRRATNSFRLEVPLNSCNSKRDRKLNPPSVVVSLVAVVSFHDSFITKLDKAYHIQCAYAEAEKTVSTDLDVKMSDEQELNGTVEPPTCDYLISDTRGASVQNSLVGELVRHRWNCKGGMASKLKMLVHQCYVKDGAGQQYEVIDQNGCTLDPMMLQTPTYSEDGMSAEVDAYVFKFPDRATVDFSCTITFCSIDDPVCQEMAPPKCTGRNNSNTLRRRKRSTHGLSSMSLHSNSLTVFDMDSSKTDSSQLLPLPFPSSLSSFEEHYDRKFCVSVASFGILISASTFFSTICIAVIFSYFFLRFQHKFSVQD